MHAHLGPQFGEGFPNPSRHSHLAPCLIIIIHAPAAAMTLAYMRSKNEAKNTDTTRFWRLYLLKPKTGSRAFICLRSLPRHRFTLSKRSHYALVKRHVTRV